MSVMDSDYTATDKDRDDLIALEKKQEKCSSLTMSSLTEILPLIMVGIILGKLMGSLANSFHREQTLWIVSPQGRKVKFPIYQALRIVRKHHWHFAVVEPIQKRRLMTRWQHIKLALFGAEYEL